ncbi:hypothetical protein [Nocardia jejuensis]|uniref:hypothetical protein n=1 Tax=Nocardia jejuensis TaxID=328049 RepID=UPI000836158C|nr:hypothetical protein [Nocardia jejuensis]
MSDLALTQERRAELAALLGDERRLRADFPRVADYLDTAPMLSGTGDQAADSAFDLRLVHYLTGGESPTGNPYWDIVSPSVSDHEGRRVANGGKPTGSARLGYAQTILQAAYAYAIPSPQTIAWVNEFSNGLPIVELGAGRGYWAAQLTNYGTIVDAYDSEPPGTSDNMSFPDAAGQRDVWHEIHDLNQYEARNAHRDEFALLLCWPPGWGNSMASAALAEFTRRGGNRLIFVGEPRGGKTGDDAFFEQLESNWGLESQDSQFVSWWNLKDVAQGWVRR